MSLEQRIVEALGGVSFHVTTEAELHEAIARVLREAAIAAEHEVALTGKDRIDFLAGDVGIEVKLDGTIPAIGRQLQRYAASSRVRVLLLVTPRMRYGHLDGRTFLGKTVRVVRISGGFL